MDEIMEKAKELGELLKNSELLARFKAAEMVFANDEAAQKATQEYEEKRQKAVDKVRESGEMTPEKLKAFQAEVIGFMDELNKNVIAKNYIEARSEFEHIISQVNGVISHSLSGEHEGGCSGSCESCGGCH